MLHFPFTYSATARTPEHQFCTSNRTEREISVPLLIQVPPTPHKCCAFQNAPIHDENTHTKTASIYKLQTRLQFFNPCTEQTATRQSSSQPHGVFLNRTSQCCSSFTFAQQHHFLAANHSPEHTASDAAASGFPSLTNSI